MRKFRRPFSKNKGILREISAFFRKISVFLKADSRCPKKAKKIEKMKKFLKISRYFASIVSDF